MPRHPSLLRSELSVVWCGLSPVCRVSLKLQCEVLCAPGGGRWAPLSAAVVTAPCPASLSDTQHLCRVHKAPWGPLTGSQRQRHERLAVCLQPTPRWHDTVRSRPRVSSSSLAFGPWKSRRKSCFPNVGKVEEGWRRKLVTWGRGLRSSQTRACCSEGLKEAGHMCVQLMSCLIFCFKILFNFQSQGKVVRTFMVSQWSSL